MHFFLLRWFGEISHFNFYQLEEINKDNCKIPVGSENNRNIKIYHLQRNNDSPFEMKGDI